MIPIFFALFASLTLSATERQLEFLPDVPVKCELSSHIEIVQDLPQKPMVMQLKQRLELDLTAMSDLPHIPLKDGPMDLTMEVRHFRVDLESDGAKESFDSSQNDSLGVMAQVSSIMNRPIKLPLDKTFSLKEEGEDFSRLRSNAPLVNSLMPKELFDQLLQLIFGLAGQQLKSGDTVASSALVGVTDTLSLPITYHINTIGEKELFATWEGKISDHVSKASVADSEATMVADIRLVGEGSWHREHALIASCSISYDLNGTVRHMGLEWPIRMSVNETLTGEPKQ